jgi:hypothetical protein
MFTWLATRSSTTGIRPSLLGMPVAYCLRAENVKQGHPVRWHR